MLAFRREQLARERARRAAQDAAIDAMAGVPPGLTPRKSAEYCVAWTNGYTGEKWNPESGSPPSANWKKHYKGCRLAL